VPAEEPRPVGRRAAKKADTRRSIQAAAMRLFSERGYEHTTVADIAGAVGISERTYFRYFATKSDVVLWDYFDEAIVAGFRDQPRSVTVIDAFRNALRDGFTQLTAAELADQYQRTELMMVVPELRSAHVDNLAASTTQLVALLAERTGLATDDPTLIACAGAVVGVTMAVHLGTVESGIDDIPAALDAALAQLNTGFANLGPKVRS
jgi:AcrR family transcriptional regulator